MKTPRTGAVGQLSFDDLILFARVVALGTLSAVARERDVPVSQISRALGRIEAAFGTRLVHRSTHGLSLTAEGQTLHEHCLRLQGALDDLDADLSGHDGQARGRVILSCSSVVAQYLILPSLASLQQRHPAIVLDLRVDDRLVDLAAEGIDIALRTGEPVTDTLVQRRLGVLQRRLYASTDYAQRHGLPVQVSDLARHRLVSNSGNPALNRWRFKGPPGEQLHVAEGNYRSDDTAITAAMTLAGLGIGRLITLVGEPLVAQGRLTRVLPELADEPALALNAVMLAQRHRHPKIRACLDHWDHWFAQALPPQT